MREAAADTQQPGREAPRLTQFAEALPQHASKRIGLSICESDELIGRVKTCGPGIIRQLAAKLCYRLPASQGHRAPSDAQRPTSFMPIRRALAANDGCTPLDFLVPGFVRVPKIL